MKFIKHIIAGLLLLHGNESFSQSVYWQQKVDHTITVSLNTTEKKLEAFQEIVYTNNSPDTLRFIYFHLWPNAYRNDKTAFSEQLLTNNRTDFYFSHEEQRGYINRLDFRVNGERAELEDHPVHQDIVRLLLPEPLPPGGSIRITTPFQVKLPALFSRSGYRQDFFAIAQWYPKPAVYDWNGWHTMPYTDQGGTYNEFGDYDVSVTIPAKYQLAATGALISDTKTGGPDNNITYRYKENQVSDFAWFTSPDLIKISDSLLLPSGKHILLQSFYMPSSAKTWNKSMAYVKEALRLRSKWHGDFPYSRFVVVDGLQGQGIKTMEYPGIAVINQVFKEPDLDLAINHAAGHMWFKGVVATDERKNEWLNEGLVSFYDRRYEKLKYGNKLQPHGFMAKHFPAGKAIPILAGLESIHRSQSIQLPSDSLKQGYFNLLTRHKTTWVLEKLEKELGAQMFDSSVQEYYRQYSYRHTVPDDLFSSFKNISGKPLPVLKGFNEPVTGTLLKNRKIKPAFLFGNQSRQDTRYVSIGPMPGYNHYDGLMVGGFIHNYQLPLTRFRFFAVPLYGTKSKNLNGLANLSWNWYPPDSGSGRTRAIRQITLGLDLARFTHNEFKLAPASLTFQFNKVAPYLRIDLADKNQLSKRENYIQYKSFLIREEWLDSRLEINGGDTILVDGTKSVSRTLQQLKFVVADHRILYPYELETRLESSRDFTRLALTGQYFANYPNREGGLKIRLFAGKFFTHGSNSIQKQFNNDRFYLNLTGANGYEDYTYSNYFAGRNEYAGWKSQQIMIRDGGFKVRTDLSGEKVGKTGNWLAAINLSADIPSSINPLSKLPVKIPLKVFADLGTFAEAWEEENESSIILFSAGLQLPLFKNLVNIYIPVIHSRIFRDYNRSTLGDKKFWKTISFSIDIQQISAGRLLSKAGL